MHPKMNRKTSYNGVRRSIGWSAIGVDAGEKKEEEKEREKGRGKDRGKDRGKTGKKAGFCRRSDVKNRLFGQKIAFFLHKFDKKSKNICIIAEFFVTLWSRFYRGTLARMYTHV